MLQMWSKAHMQMCCSQCKASQGKAVHCKCAVMMLYQEQALPCLSEYRGYIIAYFQVSMPKVNDLEPAVLLRLLLLLLRNHLLPAVISSLITIQLFFSSL